MGRDIHKAYTRPVRPAGAICCKDGSKRVVSHRLHGSSDKLRNLFEDSFVLCIWRLQVHWWAKTPQFFWDSGRLANAVLTPLRPKQWARQRRYIFRSTLRQGCSGLMPRVSCHGRVPLEWPQHGQVSNYATQTFSMISQAGHYGP
jgi:hypothetical protein